MEARLGGVGRSLAVALLLVALLLPADVTGNLVTIPLKRSVDKQKRSAALLKLKMRQANLAQGMSLIEQQAMAGDVPLEEEILSEKHLATYFGTIDIGKSSFKVLFDTGSCEFWVPSSACTTDRCERHARFPASSPRFRALMKDESLPRLSIQYLSGKVSGKMVKEPVTLGDLLVKDQEVGLASTVDIDLLDDVEWDGILGLAYPNPTLTQQGVSPLFDTIVKHNVLKSRGLSNQFAYYIDDTHGSVTFGGANCDLIARGKAKTTCINDFKFVPVTEKTYWTITLQDVKIKYPGKAEQSGFCPPGGCKAIVDTGTYLVYGPEAQVSNMVTTELKSCSGHKHMPSFTFVLHNDQGEPVSVTLNPIDYILKFENDGHDECVVGISPDKDTIWTLGQVFLRSFYTVFDRDEDRIGFARIPRHSFQALNAHSLHSDRRKGHDRSANALIETNETEDDTITSDF